MARIAPDPAAKTASRPEPAAPPAAKRPASRSGLGCYILLLVCLAQFGVIGGWAFTHFYHPSWLSVLNNTTETDTTPPEGDRPDPLKDVEAPPPTIERGDETLKEGRYDLAL